MMKRKGIISTLLSLLLMGPGPVSAIPRMRVAESPKSILSRRLKTYNSGAAPSRFNIPRGGSTEEEAASSAEGDTAVQEQPVAAGGDELAKEDAVLQEATALRQKGKELHDQGDLLEAAEVFLQAAKVLLSSSSQGDESPSSLQHLEDYCTCRLHEALCRLKLDDYDECIAVCTSILQLSDETPEQSQPYVVSAAVRARAHHRRAKAYLGLEDHEEEALQDARAASFLGDRKAVALYGKLMRGNNGGDDSVASPPMLNDLLQGKNPFLSSPSDPSSSDASSLLLESLLTKSNPLASGETPSLLGQGGAGGTLAKSLLSSLTKRLETDSDSICQYLHKTNPTQIQQLAGMAGLPISPNQASRLSGFCHSVTPKSIRRTVKYSKRAWYGITIVRKTLKVINKYKHLLVLWALAAWIQAAIRRPIPISKKAAKLAAKAAAAGRL
jgi:tetratricopeptide (TPR) repeat protein